MQLGCSRYKRSLHRLRQTQSSLFNSSPDCNFLALQIEEVVNASRAAQALVEEAHREIELSGIRPNMQLASLYAKLPLSI